MIGNAEVKTILNDDNERVVFCCNYFETADNKNLVV